MKCRTANPSNQIHRAKAVNSLYAIVALLVLVLLVSPAALADQSDTKNTSTMGSGAQYTTTVERQTEGELDAADFRQVSTLGSRIAQHLNEATAYLEDGNAKAAQPELDKALALASIIREMLPTTTVTTIVKDRKNKEVYRDTDSVQDDLVPIYEKMIAVEVVQPILDAKQEVASLKGIRLSDAEVIHTSVLLNLGYVERKLKLGKKLLSEEPGKALDELLLAQTVGVRTSVRKEDSPLLDAQRALRIAERMVNEKKYEAAETNLRLARVHLDTYSALVSTARKKEIVEVQQDVDKLFGKLEKQGAESSVRDLWSRVTAWFGQETGQTRQTTTTQNEGEKK